MQEEKKICSKCNKNVLNIGDHNKWCLRCLRTFHECKTCKKLICKDEYKVCYNCYVSERKACEICKKFILLKDSRYRVCFQCHDEEIKKCKAEGSTVWDDTQ